ncbi:MAG: aldehyde dehydrogenase family protein, partial [Proteobacteria bacterium]|nr:aldehyde dehydrogenase family protein [Pseudomonadota bacterium]
LIVLEDADIDVAVSNAAWGAYFHQGQTTMAATRILVQEKIAGEFTKRLAERARRLVVGDPRSGEVALGPLINERHLQRVDAIVQESIAAGATLDAGGSYSGLFFQPTVLSNVRPGMRCFDEEIGGPVTSVVSFGSDQEAAALANRVEYGVAAAVLSSSVGRALAIADELNVNMLHINDQTVNDEWGCSFAGRGSGGNLGAAGVADWSDYSQWQWLTVKDRPPLYPF